MFWCCCEPTTGCPPAYYDGFSSFAPVDINDVDTPRNDHWQDHGWITRGTNEPFIWARAAAGNLEVGLEPLAITTFVYAFRCFQWQPISSYSAARLGEWYELQTEVSGFDPGLSWPAGNQAVISLIGSWDFTLNQSGFFVGISGGRFYWWAREPGAASSTFTGVEVAAGQVVRERLEVVEPDPGQQNFWQYTARINGVIVRQVQVTWGYSQTFQLGSVTVGARWGAEIKLDYWNQTSSFM